MKRCPGIPLISPSIGSLLPKIRYDQSHVIESYYWPVWSLRLEPAVHPPLLNPSFIGLSFYHFISVFGNNKEHTGLHLLPPCQLANVWDLAPALLMPILRAESSVRQSSDSANRSTVYSPPTHFLFTKSQRKGKHKFLWGRESKTLLHKRHIYYLQHYIFKIFWFFYK